MTIRDRTNPRSRLTRKVGTNPAPPSLDGGAPWRPRPGLPGTGPTPTPLPVPPAIPTPTPYPEPAPTPAPVPGEPSVPGTPFPTPFPTPTPLPVPNPPGTPLPLYPEPPNMGIPGGPGSGQTPVPQPGQPGAPGAPLPPGLGLDFMREVTPDELVANQLQDLINSNSAYMTNARQRGMEYANSRGNINSSIGGGAAERAALEAAMPIAQADAQVYRDANAGNFDSLSQLRQMRVAGDIENWLNSESYTRDFNGQLAMLPITSAIDMMQYIAQRGLEDPAVYTPDVMSGFNNFFNGNMFDILNRYFGTPPGGG